MKKSLQKQILFGAAALGAGLIARSAARSKYSFSGKSVVITGGSRGLGLVIARILAREGANLTLVARDRDALEIAEQELNALDAEVLTIAADVRNRQEARSIIEQAAAQFGTVDVLINNAGIIQVGPFDAMSVKDFEDAMATHFWGPLHSTLAAIPYMRDQGGGRIVNISSIGGRVAVPHLAPYTASKFALAGLSDALRAELAPLGIAVTSVFPGLMRTGSHVNANFKGNHEREFAWFSAMSSLPFFSMNADRAARQIVEACRAGRSELIVSTPARIAVATQGVAPSLIAWSMRIMHALLPSARGEAATELRSGWQSMSAWSPSLLTRLADRAVPKNNETRVA